MGERIVGPDNDPSLFYYMYTCEICEVVMTMMSDGLGSFLGVRSSTCRPRLGRSYG